MISDSARHSYRRRHKISQCKSLSVSVCLIQPKKCKWANGKVRSFCRKLKNRSRHLANFKSKTISKTKSKSKSMSKTRSLSRSKSMSKTRSLSRSASPDDDNWRSVDSK